MTCTCKFELLKEDFEKVLEKLSDSYSIGLIQEGAQIATILLALDRLGMKKENTGHDTGMPGSVVYDINWFLNIIPSELSAAERYIQLFRSTNDESYRKMAKDELGHAAVLIERARSMARTQTEQEALRDLITRHDIMAKSI